MKWDWKESYTHVQISLPDYLSTTKYIMMTKHLFTHLFRRSFDEGLVPKMRI